MTRTCDNCKEHTTDATRTFCTTCACALPIQTADSRPASGPEASDTPETDNALQGVYYRGDHGSAIPALCRKLERERNGARSKQLRSLDGSTGSLYFCHWSRKWQKCRVITKSTLPVEPYLVFVLEGPNANRTIEVSPQDFSANAEVRPPETKL
jgi:hypothetical protein